MLSDSWLATGLVRPVWAQLDVEKDHRGELARLTGIQATVLSAINTGKRPMTLETAQRIADAVPGVTLIDLGAPEESAPVEYPLIRRRLEALEAYCDELQQQTAGIRSLSAENAQGLRELTERFEEALAVRLSELESRVRRLGG